MKTTTFKLYRTNPLLIALFLFRSPVAGAYAACCAGHGGVASCNKATNFMMCKDKTQSPTCKCPVKPKKNTVPKTSTTIKTNKVIKKTPATTGGSWWGGTSTPAKTTTKGVKSTTTTPGTNGNSAKGCCSHHDGVKQCNKATHHYTCGDDTESPSCTCQ